MADGRGFIRTGGVRWAYRESGTGSDLWVSFHGYGQSADTLVPFTDALLPGARVIHFDLPHHGSTGMDKPFLHPSELADLLGHLLREKSAERCSVVAFSLGGKVALKLAELIPGRIERMVLIAPDGLWVNPLYRFTIGTRLGRWLYGRVIADPSLLFAICRSLAAIRLIHPSLNRFIRSQLGTRERRQRVWDVWQAFSRITPDIGNVQRQLHRYGLRVLLVMGRHDRVIRPSLGKRLVDKSEGKAEQLLLPRGHDLFTEEAALELRQKRPDFAKAMQ